MDSNNNPVLFLANNICNFAIHLFDVFGSNLFVVISHQESEKTALMVACEAGHLDIAKILLSCGADANLCDVVKIYSVESQ